MKRLFLLLILCSTLGAVDLFAQDLYKVTSTSGLNVRSEPNTNSTILGRLANGQLIEVDTFVGNWAEFQYNDKTAYVYSKYISKVVGEQEPETYRVINASHLNVRSQPTTQSTVVGSLAQGDKVEVFSVEGSWARIKYKDKTAYVSTKYLEKIEEEPQDEIISPIEVADTAEKTTTTTTSTPKQNNRDYLWCGGGNSTTLLNFNFSIITDVPEGAKVFGMSYEFLYNYYLVDYVSIGTGLGCAFSNFKTESGSYMRKESMAHLQLPVEAAVTFPFGADDNMGIRIGAGPRFNFTISHTINTEDGNYYESYTFKEIREERGDDYKIFSCSLDLSARFIFKWLSFGVGYTIPLAKNASLDSGVFSIGAGLVF